MGCGYQTMPCQGIQMEDETSYYLLCRKLINGQLPLGSHFSPVQDCPLCGDKEDTDHLMYHSMALDARTQPNPIPNFSQQPRRWMQYRQPQVSRVSGKYDAGLNIINMDNIWTSSNYAGDFTSQENERRNVAFG